ncbi:short-chain dehydrogenase/reductase [Xylaria cf. heliscus]|nr:short-chain dehydrogenase/reductase [Xylaria cf. heliscus]
MSDPNSITALETREGGPPADFPSWSQSSKLRWAVKNLPSDPQVSFAGKTVLVTGANTGLGFEAAVKYATHKAERLILAVRSTAKGEDTKARIVQRTGYDSSSITILTVDLASFESVQAFATALFKSTNTLDIALLNAGLGNPTYEKSPTGWEMALQVNVLSTALMAVLILPLLRATAAARGSSTHLTFVNSNGHDFAKREWLDGSGSLLKTCNDKNGWIPEQSYSMVKLMGMAIMQAVARAATVAPTGQAGTSPPVIVNAVCPGLCKTDLGRNFGLGAKIAGFFFFAAFSRSAEQGSRSLVSATALGPESHGRFWHHDVLYPIGEMAKDEELMKRTWDEIWAVISEGRPELEKALNSGV